MVTTRASTRASSVTPSESPSPSTPTSSRKGRKGTMTKSSPRAATKTSGPGSWAHTPTTLTFLWMAISLPLVLWDTGYVLGRPHTMVGGKWHRPIWSPYALYAEIDYVYGLRALETRNGFTSAQASLNLLETFLYMVYMGLYFSKGKSIGGVVGERKKLVGKDGALAALVGFTAAVMTLSKTLLYGANEYFSGFDNIGHNSGRDLFFLYIFPNGSWIVGSAIMVYSLGGEILDGLARASASHQKVA